MLSTIVEKIENILDHKEAQAINTATKIIDAACTAIQKIDALADAALPIIEAIETNPIFQSISADIPGAEGVEAAIITILNRYQNFIKAAAADPQILRGLQERAIAEVTSVIHGVQRTIDGYLNKVISFLVAMGW